MYLLYIDESENSDSRKEQDILNIFSLSGLLITDRYVTSFVQSFCELKNKYKIPLNKEIHGYNIFNTNKWCGLPDDDRRKFCNDFANLIVNRNSVRKGFFIFKGSTFGKSDYENCLKKIIHESSTFVAIHAGQTGKQLLIIFDEKDDLQQSINCTILKLRESIPKETKKNCKKICRIIDHGFPGKSNMSEILQAADFVAYVSRLSLTIKREDSNIEKAKDPRFIEFVDGLVAIFKKNNKVKFVNLDDI